MKLRTLTALAATTALLALLPGVARAGNPKGAVADAKVLRTLVTESPSAARFRKAQNLVWQMKASQAALARGRTTLPRAVRTALATASGYKTGSFLEGYLRRDIQRDFRLFDLLLFLMLVPAGVGLLNGMTIAMLGRVRELGVLRALGTKRGSLCGSFLLEGAVVAGLASLLACGLGVVMGHLLVYGMNNVARLDAPVTLPWVWFLLVPVLAFGTAVVASLVPALRALRESPAESVRYE